MADTIKNEYRVDICTGCIYGFEYGDWDTERQRDNFYRNFPGNITLDLHRVEDGSFGYHFSNNECDCCAGEAGTRVSATIYEWI